MLVNCQTYAGDDSMERAAGISKSVLARRKLAEVLGSSGHSVIVEFENDSAGWFRVDSDVKLCEQV